MKIDGFGSLLDFCPLSCSRIKVLLIFVPGNASLADLPPDLIRNKYLCEKHFSDNDFRTEKRHFLKKDAVPLKFSDSSERQNNGSSTESLMVLTPQKTYSGKKRPLCPQYTPV